MTPSLYQRNTRQRQVILDELQRVRSHPTAVALHAIVQCRLPKISLGTVYRNLELLTRSGLIRKLEFAGAESRFDGNVQQHDHVRCLRCGRVDDVSAVPLDFSQANANDWCGYEILGHRLEFFGLCPECRTRPDETGGGDASTITPIHTATPTPKRDQAMAPHKPR